MCIWQPTDLLSSTPVDKLNIQPRLNGNTTQFISVIPSASYWDRRINGWEKSRPIRSVLLWCHWNVKFWLLWWMHYCNATRLSTPWENMSIMDALSCFVATRQRVNETKCIHREGWELSAAHKHTHTQQMERCCCMWMMQPQDMAYSRQW